MHTDIACDLGYRPMVINDKGNRFCLVLLGKATACRTHSFFSRLIRAANPCVHQNGNGPESALESALESGLEWTVGSASEWALESAVESALEWTLESASEGGCSGSSRAWSPRPDLSWSWLEESQLGALWPAGVFGQR